MGANYIAFGGFEARFVLHCVAAAVSSEINDKYPSKILVVRCSRLTREIPMLKTALNFLQFLVLAGLLSVAAATHAQQKHTTHSEASGNNFGPNVRTYLNYLRDEQEVVDDRQSRREISHAYYLRNSSRIRALRKMAIQIARESKNDYLPEMEAVTRDEFGRLFEKPLKFEDLRAGEVVNNTYKFLGAVRSNELFYVFARLDIYEQQELLKKSKSGSATSTPSQPASASGHLRRVDAP